MGRTDIQNMSLCGKYIAQKWLSSIFDYVSLFSKIFEINIGHLLEYFHGHKTFVNCNLSVKTYTRMTK